MGRNELGQLGEAYAAQRLEQAGYQIVARNFTCRLGELDLIAYKGENIAFIEVKTRREGYLYRPALAVNRAKQSKIIRAAYVYLQRNPTDRQPRFDVIEIVVAREGPFFVQEYQHYKNAFGLDG